jgi:hypothetical protein
LSYLHARWCISAFWQKWWFTQSLGIFVVVYLLQASGGLVKRGIALYFVSASGISFINKTRGKGKRKDLNTKI